MDAPGVLVGMCAGGVAELAAAAVLFAIGWSLPALVLLLGGVILVVSAALFGHTTLRGKFLAWDDELDRLALAGDERILDLGCGRGLVLLKAAARLPEGRATGVDLWSSRDQSGNSEDATWANALAEGVADRIELVTGDMRELPFAGGTFDVVVSSLAVHNIPDAEGRARVVAEALRVLKPGVGYAWPIFGTSGSTRPCCESRTSPMCRFATSAGGSGTAVPTRALQWSAGHGIDTRRSTDFSAPMMAG